MDHTKSLRVSSDICLRISQVDVGQDRRQKSVIFRKIAKFQNQGKKNGAHRRSSRQILAGVWDLRKLFSFLKHRLSIIITVAPVCEQQKKRTHSGGNQEIILSVSIGWLACAGQWIELNAHTSSYLVLEGKNLVCYCNTISY